METNAQLLENLNHASADFRTMADGHNVLGGFCIAMANRLDNCIMHLMQPTAAETVTQPEEETETCNQ